MTREGDLPTGATEEGPYMAAYNLLRVRQEYVADVREITRDQVDLWRLVPMLAIQANGRTSHEGQFAFAYRWGYWDFESPAIGTTGKIMLDLESGELVDRRSVFDPDREGTPELASDLEILNFMGQVNPIKLDAEAVIAQLKEHAEKPLAEKYIEIDGEGWRERVIEERNLTPIYTRHIDDAPNPYVW